MNVGPLHSGPIDLSTGASLPETERSPAGWLVLDPDGNVAASGGQTVTEASADAGEETADGSD